MIEFPATTKRLAMRFMGALLIAAFVLSAISTMAQAHVGNDLGAPSHGLQPAADDGGHGQPDGGVDHHANTCCPVPCQWEASKPSEVAALVRLFDAPWPNTLGHTSDRIKIPPKRPPRAAV